MKIVVRSSKDRSAVIYAIEKFFGGDPAIDVITLGGARKCDEILDRVKDVASKDDIYIVLLGRESSECRDLLLNELDYNIYVHFVPRQKVRNLRLEHLAWEIVKAKSLVRLTIGWLPKEHSYVFYKRRGSEELHIPPDPGYDAFLLLGKGLELLNQLLKIPCTLPLLIRGYGGEHRVFCGCLEVGKILIPDSFTDIAIEKHMLVHEVTPSLDKTLKANLELTKLVIERASNILNKFFDGCNTVVVPLSGGKDSTLCLVVAVKTFGSEKVRAVYVDTGLEFPQTREYVETICSKLGVELTVLRAPLREEVVRRQELPTHGNRWCTQIKIGVLEKYIQSINGRKLVVVGDRDAESRSRSWRATVRVQNDVVYVAPIKPWSTAQVQVSLLNLSIPMNPLYELGFYRIGCYICPSLRSWEYRVILFHSNYFQQILADSLFTKFIEMKRREAKMSIESLSSYIADNNHFR